MSHRVTRTLITATLMTLALLVRPAPARADVTAFWGFTPTTSVRDTRGFSVGLNTAIFGGEYEWARQSEDTAENAPGLKTHMFNGMLITPGRKISIYLSGGFGRYTETLNLTEQTGSATNFGAGVKYRLAGPIKLRVDYRAFTLKGTPTVKHPKRIYAGLTLAF
jgi:hypothetical protein